MVNSLWPWFPFTEQPAVPHWPNVLAWSKASHARDKRSLGSLYFLDGAHPVSLVQGAMFAMVHQLTNLPWQRVEQILAEQRRVLVGMDWWWGDDMEAISKRWGR